MTSFRIAPLALLAAASLAVGAPSALRAQERENVDSAVSATVSREIRHGDRGAAAHGTPCEHEAAPGGQIDFITPHITDSPCIDLPYWKAPFVKEVRAWPFAPLRIGPLDITPTKHTWMLLLAAALTALVLVTAARAHRRHHHAVGVPRGFAAGIESLVLYLRNEVILPNVGHHGDAYVPFCLTLFFFILFANTLGLVPYGSTATGNIAVTATLAIITFIVVEVAGMRALGKGYLGTIVYWPKE